MENKDQKEKTIEQEFEATAKKLGLLNSPKRLIVDEKFQREFEANGKQYVVMPPDKVFNITRQVAYQNLELIFATNQTPTDIKKRFLETSNTLLRLMGAKGQDWEQLCEKLLRDTFNNLDSFKGKYTSRYPVALYICTLFIVRENEDLGDWDFDLANDKIDDWTKENLSPVDFFGLALASSNECQLLIEAD